MDDVNICEVYQQQTIRLRYCNIAAINEIESFNICRNRKASSACPVRGKPNGRKNN